MEEEKNTWVEVEPQTPPETPETPETKAEDDGSEAGPRAQKRIKRLLGERKSLAEENERLKQEVEAARTAAAEAAEKARGSETSANSVYKQSLQEKLKVAEAQWQAAYDAADKDTLLAAQNAMTEAKLKLMSLEAWETAPQPQPKPQPPQQQQRQPQLAPATKAWIDNNSWFGRGANADKAATAVAVAISDDLVSEGFDPASSEFYEEVEKRLLAEMPRMASKLRREEAPRTVVAGQSRNPGRRIRLDEGTVKASQRLGASLEDTARYAEAISAAGDGYVTIDVRKKK